MNNYRICENRYGYFKVQEWKPPYKIWGIFPVKGEWENVIFGNVGSRVERFNTKEEAQKKIDWLVSIDMKWDDDWRCPEESE